MFTDDFLIKSFAELVDEEGRRILNDRLTTYEPLKRFVEAEIKKEPDLLKSLSALHIKLAKMKLPEDVQFEPAEKEPEEEEMKKALKEFVEQDEQDLKQLSFIVSDALSKIASWAGEQGNHEAAYKIEKLIRELQNA